MHTKVFTVRKRSVRTGRQAGWQRALHTKYNGQREKQKRKKECYSVAQNRFWHAADGWNAGLITAPSCVILTQYKKGETTSNPPATKTNELGIEKKNGKDSVDT